MDPFTHAASVLASDPSLSVAGALAAASDAQESTPVRVIGLRLTDPTFDLVGQPVSAPGWQASLAAAGTIRPVRGALLLVDTRAFTIRAVRQVIAEFYDLELEHPVAVEP
jgi:hypothetical protein